jgi:hypothetical protein
MAVRDEIKENPNTKYLLYFLVVNLLLNLVWRLLSFLNGVNLRHVADYYTEHLCFLSCLRGPWMEQLGPEVPPDLYSGSIAFESQSDHRPSPIQISRSFPHSLQGNCGHHSFFSTFCNSSFISRPNIRRYIASRRKPSLNGAQRLPSELMVNHGPFNTLCLSYLCFFYLITDHLYLSIRAFPLYSLDTGFPNPSLPTIVYVLVGLISRYRSLTPVAKITSLY